MRSVALILGIALAAAPAAGSAQPAKPFDLEAAKASFEAKCAQCHVLDRTLQKNKDKAGWEKTVARMKGYVGDKWTEAEATTIVEYLTRVRGPKP